MKTLYSATMTNVGGRNGRASSPDGAFALDVATPREMSGKETTATNPEQLFAAGYSSCFNGALEVVLQKARVSYSESRVTAVVSLLEDPADKSWKIAVHLKIAIDGLSQADTLKYATLAHKICPYSKATRGNVEVTLEAI